MRSNWAWRGDLPTSSGRMRSKAKEDWMVWSSVGWRLWTSQHEWATSAVKVSLHCTVLGRGAPMLKLALRLAVWASQYPPNSQPTDITLSQFLSIQEKGVSAWSFEPDYESNPGIIVQSRTEVIFLSDSIGMAPEEGGGCCVQSNLPIPKLNEVYYWECKMFEKPEGTNVAIGLATKPFPSFRLPGESFCSLCYRLC